MGTHTKTVSTQQNQQALDNTHYLKVSDYPVNIFGIEGQVNSTNGTAYYIQLVGTSAPSSGSTVPLYSRLAVPANAATQNNGFSFIYDPILLATDYLTNPVGAVATAGANTLPVYVAISSTDNVYTAVNASTQVSVIFEETILEARNQTITGDLTTGVDSLAVWATPNAGKRLTRFDVINKNGGSATSGTLTSGLTYIISTFVAGDDFTNIGAAVNASGTIFKATGTTPTTWSNGSTVKTVSFLMLFGFVPSAGNLPMAQWAIPYDATAVTTELFGVGGQEMIDSNPTTFVPSYGCYLYGSTTTQTLTVTSSTNWNIKTFNI